MTGSAARWSRIHAWLASRFELGRASPTAPSDQSTNMPAMEGMRGFAVFLVFLVHYTTLMAPWTPQGSVHMVAAALHTVGNAGVDLFFVLSGYLIYGSLIARRIPFWRFMRRRFERIYPAFIAVLAIYLVLSAVYPSRSKIPAGWQDGAVYVAQNFFLLPGLLPIAPIITVAWSLSYEMFFYLVVPLVVTALALRERSVSWRTTMLVIVALAVLGLAAMFGGPVRLAMFLAGMLLFETMQGRMRWMPSSALSIALLTAGLLSTLFVSISSAGQAARTAALAVSFFGVGVTVLTAPSGALARAFSWTPLRWLGNMSYSYYLVHGLALNALVTVIARWLDGIGPSGPLLALMLPVTFAATLVPSAMLFLWVERPLSLTPRRRASTARTSADGRTDASIAARRG